MTANTTALIPKYTDEFIRIYRDGLLEDIIPFWIEHSVDGEHGGFMFSVDRDGTLIDTDKGVWQQGRFVWMLATLYNTVEDSTEEQREEWLELARHGLDFIDAHCFDDDGRMYFLVTREGKPLRKRRYIFSECFTIIAFAAYAQATGDAALLQRAVDLFNLTTHYLTTPGLLPPKTDPETRPMKGLSVPMILITTAQVLREAGGDPELCNTWIDRCIDEIERDFMHPELRAVLEVVGENGEFLDCFDGRTVTPGHAIEAAWFILDEAAHRDTDARLTEIGTTILDWSWEIGWDEEYGGLLYCRDMKGLPVQEYWHDMKFWWPHNEAIIAMLLAYQLTGDEKYALRHKLAHEWTFRHFPDHEYGEWFGYLHRDGRISVPLKGNQWKSAFHVPRMYWKCWQILEEIKAGG
jgi:N-acylglucosamine 2-epimerase